MGITLLFIAILAFNLGITSLRRRSECSLHSSLSDEYEKAKFVPTSILLPLVAIGFVVAGFSGRYVERWPVIGLIFPAFLAAAFVTLRILKERKLRALDLPKDFVLRERIYSFTAASALVGWAAVNAVAR